VGRKAVLALAIVGALATLAYWVIWFFVDRDWLASAHTESYYAYENSFPLADAWLTWCLACAAFTLWKRRESAMLWLLLGGSAALYLGGMDVLFDLENGIYRAPTGDWGSVVVEVLINVFCLVGGAVAVVYGWRQRRYFASLSK
jgi:hypothetical protein